MYIFQSRDKENVIWKRKGAKLGVRHNHESEGSMNCFIRFLRHVFFIIFIVKLFCDVTVGCAPSLLFVDEHLQPIFFSED